MSNINIKNFYTKLPEIENSIKDAKLISVDLEFTALHPLKTPSLFDSPNERYSKLRINLAQIIPIQVGITTFTFNPNDRSYHGKMYNFYILPACFPTIQRSFYFQSDTLNFLKLHKFDFNELVYLGIPFINRQQETQLREILRNETVTENQACCRVELDVVYKKLYDVIKIWYQEANIDDHLSLPEIYNKCKYNYEMLYFIQKYIRRCFKYLWTSVENNEFIVKLVSEHEYKILEKTINLEEELINNLLGFTRIFRLITSIKKPLIGHNLLQDILLLISSFETPLPRKYSEFKKLATLLFPSVFDTKSISYQLKNIIPEEKCWADSSLETLFEYFRNGTGRHLALNAPAIIITQDNNYGKFHEAGWDSFCAGYIFIRLAYLNIYHKFPKSKTFMSNELIGGLSDLKNRVNIIRGAVSYVKIDGEDPISTRPPLLVIESIKNKPIDICRVSSILDSFGFIEVRKLPYQSKRVIIAVDNFASARRILNNFKTHNEFQVKQYNAIKHSSVLRAFISCGITISGAILLWLTHRCYKIY